MPPVVAHGETEACHRGRGPHARRPRQGAGGDALARRQGDALRIHALEHRPGADLDAAAAQLARRERRQARRDLRHDPVLRLDKHEARALEPAARIAVDHVGHVVLKLGHALHPGVARTHEDEGEVGAARFVIRLGLRHLEVPERPVAESYRVGQALKAHAVLGQPRHVQHPWDGAERDHELVVAERLVAAVHGAHRQLVHGRVSAR